jgi:hypothetical protein
LKGIIIEEKNLIETLIEDIAGYPWETSETGNDFCKYCGHIYRHSNAYRHYAGCDYILANKLTHDVLLAEAKKLVAKLEADL